jgi:prefoldin subunit 5
MNKERRKALSDLRSTLEGIKGDIDTARDTLSSLKEEEGDYKDNMPESMQGGEKGDAADSAVSALEDADSELDTAMTTIDEAISKIEEAEA